VVSTAAQRHSATEDVDLRICPEFGATCTLAAAEGWWTDDDTLLGMATGRVEQLPVREQRRCG
jgi:hypothetical protein